MAFLLALRETKDLNAEDHIWGTPLYCAIAKSDIFAVEKLIEAGADVHVTSVKKHPALWKAISVGDLGVIEMLLKSGADPNEEQDYNDTAMHFAKIEECSEKIIDLLVQYGGDRYLIEGHTWDEYQSALWRRHI